MKRALLLCAVLVACEGAGALLVTVSPEARSVARAIYVTLWHWLPGDVPPPDRFK